MASNRFEMNAAQLRTAIWPSLQQFAKNNASALAFLHSDDVLRPRLCKARLGIPWDPGWNALSKEARTEELLSAMLGIVFGPVLGMGKGNRESFPESRRSGSLWKWTSAAIQSIAMANDPYWASRLSFDGSQQALPEEPEIPDVQIIRLPPARLVTRALERGTRSSLRRYDNVDLVLTRDDVHDYIEDEDWDGLRQWLVEMYEEAYCDYDYVPAEAGDGGFSSDETLEETVETYPDLDALVALIRTQFARGAGT